MSKIAVVVFLAVLGVTLLEASQQTYKVKGKFLCGGSTSNGKQTTMKLLNKRFGFDDTKKAKCNNDGTFSVEMTVNRMGSFSPELHVYTNCNDQILGIPKLCKRKLVYKLDPKYTNNGAQDLGTINLEVKQKDEGTECL